MATAEIPLQLDKEKQTQFVPQFGGFCLTSHFAVKSHGGVSKPLMEAVQ